MGCASSKVDNEEKVARCKARKRFMKHAVASRHNFAASHAAYMQALKNVGAAFRQFGETELRDSATAGSASPPTPDAKTPPRQLFLPPPSPPRSISDGSIAKAGSSPETEGFSPESSPKKPAKQKKGYFHPPPPPLPLGSAPPPPPPLKTSAWEFLDPFHSNEAVVPVVNETHQPERRRITGKLWFPPADSAAQEEQGTMVSNEKMDDAALSNSLAIVVPTQRSSNGRKELVDVLRELDELFLKAYESGKDAGRLLEARKIHYQSNFVESKGHDSHSSRVLNAISWGHWPSLKSPMKSKTEDPITFEEPGDTGIHSGTLDRLFVWEKKLYDEMRAAEAGRLEYEKKCTLLRHQDSKGDYNESIDKTRSQIKMIQSRIVVALEGVDTASSAIIKIRDEELYPQLLELQEGLTRMWADLYSVHERQYEVVSKMRPLDSLLGSVEATSNIHRLATSQLEAALDNWYSCLNKLVTSQRDYMRNLSGWVRLCVMPFEDLKESSSYNKDSSALASPTRVALPPVHDVCLEWHQALDRLPDKVALEAIKSFVAVTHKIVELQNEELRHRKKVEALSKELEKKMNFIQNYEKKHPASAAESVESRHSSSVDESEEIVRDILPPKSPLADRRVAVDLLRRRLEEEKEQVAKAVYDTRAMTLNSLHTGLPSVFQSIAGFAGVCSQAFQVLYYNAQSSNNNNSYGSYSP